MPPLLPIDQRDLFTVRPATLLEALAPRSPGSGTPLSKSGTASTGLKLCVKNTFLDLEPAEAEGHSDWYNHESGSHTCVARMLPTPVAQGLLKHFAGEHIGDGDGEEIEAPTPSSPLIRTPLSMSDVASQSLMSDVASRSLMSDVASQSLKLCVKNTFIDLESTEVEEHSDWNTHHNGSHSCVARMLPTPVAQGLLKGLAREIEENTGEQQTITSPSTAQMAHRLSFKIPLDVVCGSQSSLTSLQFQKSLEVAIRNISVDVQEGRTAVDLRVVLDATDLAVSMPSSLPQLSPSLPDDKADASSVSAPRVRPRRTSRTAIACSAGHEPATSAMLPGDAIEKSAMVCRHWRSKGWCRYQAECRFMHPEHKRGVRLGAQGGCGPGPAVKSVKDSPRAPAGSNSWPMTSVDMRKTVRRSARQVKTMPATTGAVAASAVPVNVGDDHQHSPKSS